MPQVPRVIGQPAGPSVIVQPAIPEDLIEAKPEPAIKVADIPIPTQDELAARSIATQTVTKRNAMTPSTEKISDKPIYQFTDEDREKSELARAAKRYDWETVSLDDALSHLAEVRLECERGGIILQRRVSELKVESVKCYSCENIINLSEGRFAGMRTRNNLETGIPESAYACSAACYLKLQREFIHPVQIRQPVER